MFYDQIKSHLGTNFKIVKQIKIRSILYYITYCNIQAELYLCTPIKVDYTKDYFIIGFEPNATMNTAHHMLLYGCGAPGSEKPVWLVNFFFFFIPIWFLHFSNYIPIGIVVKWPTAMYCRRTKSWPVHAAREHIRRFVMRIYRRKFKYNNNVRLFVFR